MGNTIILSGNIDAKALFNLRSDLKKNTSNSEIVIYSSGGDLNCAFAMFDLIRECKYKITTTVLGKCYSAAVIPFLAGEVRKMYLNATLLIHEPYTSFPEDKPYTINDLAYEVERLNLNREKLLGIFEQKTKLKREDILKFYSNGQTLLTAEDCLKYGIATNII